MTFYSRVFELISNLSLSFHEMQARTEEMEATTKELKARVAELEAARDGKPTPTPTPNSTTPTPTPRPRNDAEITALDIFVRENRDAIDEFIQFFEQHSGTTLCARSATDAIWSQLPAEEKETYRKLAGTRKEKTKNMNSKIHKVN